MFNLLPHYQFFIKVVRKLTDKSNLLYSVFPFKYALRCRFKNYLQSVNRSSLKNKLKNILGHFEDFSSLEIKEVDRKKLIQRANNTIDHKFDILGSGLVEVNPIDWHSDFKSNYTWRKGTFYKNYEIVNLNNDADVKVVWDLSRCHHLLWLGQAYLLTKEERYAKEVVFQIEDWIKENPLMYSINWTCAMDVSIRIVNWMYALNMITSSKCITDNFSKKITKSIHEHGFFIYKNLEKSTPYSSNHYVANVTGLIYIGSFLHEFVDGIKWKRFGLSEFYSEIRTQVLSQGVHYEKSISYHRLVTEFFVYPYFMLLRLQEKVPNDIEEKLKHMFCFVRDYTKPNGKAPLIGDNDNGRFLPFVETDFNEHGYLIEIAKQFYQDSTPKSNYIIDAYFALKGVSKSKRRDFDSSIQKSTLFSEAGFAILKKEDFYLFFKNEEYSKFAAPTSKLIGTHSHADALSFELSIGKDDFIIDPGTYCYTSSAELRNEFRSTKKHNTIHLDNLDQVELVDSNIFAVKGYRYPEKIHHVMVDNTEVLSGVFKWKIPEQKSITHTRNIILENVNKFHVLDEIDNSNSHNFTLSYHFSDQVKTTLIENTVVLGTKSGAVLTIDFEISIDFKITIIKDTISPSYGIIKKSKTMRLECNSDKSFFIKSNFIYKSKK